MQNQNDYTDKIQEKDAQILAESNLKTLKFLKSAVSVMQAVGISILPIALCIFCVFNFTKEYKYYLGLSYVVLAISSVICLVTVIAMAVIKIMIAKAEKTPFSIKNLLKSNIEIWLLAIALIYTIVSTMIQYFTNLYLGDNKSFLFFGNNYNREGLIAVLFYAMIFIASYTLNNEKHKKIVLASIIVSAVVIGATIVGILMSGANLQSKWYALRVVAGIFNNSNHNGYFMCVAAMLAAMLAIYSKNPIITIICSLAYVLSSFCLLISECLGSHIGLVLGLIFMVIVTFITNRKYNWKIILILGLGIAVFAAAELTKLSNLFSDYTRMIKGILEIGKDASSDAAGASGSGRWSLWMGTLDVIGQSPWIGKGLDCYYSNNYYNQKLDMPHNEYIQLASNVGIPVLILYLAAILLSYFRALKLRKTVTEMEMIGLVCAFAYCVSAFFGNTFTYTYPYFLILFAFGIPKKKKLCRSAEF